MRKGHRTAAMRATDILVGERLRIARVAIGLTQSALAVRLDLSFQQVQKYEKGTNRVSAGMLLALAEILNVPIGYFFDESDVEISQGTRASLELQKAAVAVDPEIVQLVTRLLRLWANRPKQ